MKLLSFDAETNGLWGQAFSIAAVVYDTEAKETTAEFIGRCPIQEDVNPWVAENVLPEMASIPVTHKDYADLLESFVDFYTANKEDALVLVHMGLPVEAKVFLDAHKMGFLGDWDAPYPLVDCSAIPEIGTSVDSYNANHGIVLPGFIGGTHNPLYDSYAAMYAYIDAVVNHG